MSVDNDLLAKLGLAKGDAPMSAATFNTAVTAIHRLTWPKYRRDQTQIDPSVKAEHDAWLTGKAATLAAAQVNARHNRDLARYIAADLIVNGRAEVTEERDTGTFDEAGQPITETVVVRAAVEAQPATIEQDIRDQDTGEVTGTETVPNPAVVAAQEVVDATPADVVAWAAENQE